MSIKGFVCAGVLLALPGWSQNRVDSMHRVDAGSMYHRVYAIVPLVGTGKPGDPKRPKFAPLPSEMKADHSGILGFQMQLSDDGKTALVEFVAANREALKEILGTTDPSIKVFEKGVASQAAIEAAFQTQKKGFSLSNGLNGVVNSGLSGLMSARVQ